MSTPNRIIVTCAQCGKKLRLPAIPEVLQVTCPSCRHQWSWTGGSNSHADQSTVNYYELLQVSKRADMEIIEAAYKRLALRYHPDRNPGDAHAEKMMIVLNIARETLVDPIRRAQYDREQEQSSTEQSAQHDTQKPDSSDSYRSSNKSTTPRTRSPMWETVFGVAFWVVIAILWRSGCSSDGTTIKPSGGRVYPEVNGRVPNGHGWPPRPFTWEFSWPPVPKAERYEIVIEHPSVTIGPQAKEVFVPRYRADFRNISFPAESLSGWSWKLRAMVGGRWSVYSDAQYFSVEPARQ